MCFVRRCFRTVLLILTCTLPAGAQTAASVAQTPPMGWNSWDSYGLTITEQQFRENAAVLHDRLLPLGWRYAVIDEGWYFQNPEDRPHPEKLRYELDAFGRYIPVPARFPSATANGKTGTVMVDGNSAVEQSNQGFAALGRWLHAQGLQFGIHIVRGIPRESVRRNLPVEGSDAHAQDAADQTDACPWDPTNWGVRDNAAGQAWYDALLRQYATWGVDLLKVDCIADHPYKQSEILQIRRAMDRSGRPMVLSLSPGPTNLSHAEEVSRLAQMWRISDDVWDVWQGGTWPSPVKTQFPRLAAWAPYAKPGSWPDADMLPLGELAPRPDVGPGPRHTRLTPDEQRTLLTLWSIGRSPLILGANLTQLDPATLALITNREMIRVDQTARASRQVMQDGDLIAWTADLPGGGHAVAVFNTGDTPITRDLTRDLALSQLFPGRSSRAMEIQDVWAGSKTRANHLTANLPPHGCLYVLVQPVR